jgi:Transposase zinc-ribbon domain/ISXO2-like transposase domain
VEDYPRNLAEFERRFATDELCRDYLMHLRWPGGFRCPRCGGGKFWPQRVILLQCAACDYQSSIIAGTIFQDTHGYKGLEQKGYPCEISVIGKQPKDAVKLLPHVHLVVALLKRWLLGTHQGKGAVSRAYLPYYLDEFTFRFNRRKSKSRGKLFYRLVEQAVTSPVPSGQLVPVEESASPAKPQAVGAT